MGSLMIRIVLAVVSTTAVALFARAENVSAAELATAQGTISIAAAPTGMAAPRCADSIHAVVPIAGAEQRQTV